MGDIVIRAKVRRDPAIMENIAFVNVFEARKVPATAEAAETWKYTSYTLKCFKDNIKKAGNIFKGDRVIATGNVDGINPYVNDKGEDRSSIEVMVRMIDKLVPDDTSNYPDKDRFEVNKLQEPAKAVVEEESDLTDDIPF